ncbi:MAG: hypothetical protein LBE27_04080 [Deltaproteobacteria bacterium]|jgi:hypothetical protein|nr:hypothetical protein [Deltaproteobacteria bacterium]
MPRSLINKSSLSGSSPIFLNNKAVVAWYGPIQEELKKSKELKDFLAEPVVLRQEDTIEWYSSLDGTPQRVRDLPPEEEAVAQGEIEYLLGLFKEQAEKFRASQDFQMKQKGIFMLEAVSHQEVLDFFKIANSYTATLWGHSSARSLYYPLGRVAQEPAEELPPPPPPKTPISLKKFSLLMATGLITGLALILALGFIFFKEILFSLNYLVHMPGPPSSEILSYNRDMETERAKLYEEKLRYLESHQSCLIIPKDDKAGVNFLKGCWQIPDTEFLNSESGELAKLSFCHSDGKTQLKVQGGSLSCQADARASLGNGRLTIDSQSELSCGSGKSYPQLSISCEPGAVAGTTAKCSLLEKNWEGKDYSPIPVNPKRELQSVPKT